jgi:hypothetical protein
MIGTTAHQSWLFYLPLAQQVSLLKDDLLDPVDQLLDDSTLIDLVRRCLAARRPASTRTGRPGIAPDRLLRCCVLKHLKGWSFRDLERELRSNLLYRRFEAENGIVSGYQVLEATRPTPALGCQRWNNTRLPSGMRRGWPLPIVVFIPRRTSVRRRR